MIELGCTPSPLHPFNHHSHSFVYFRCFFFIRPTIITSSLLTTRVTTIIFVIYLFSLLFPRFSYSQRSLTLNNHHLPSFVRFSRCSFLISVARNKFRVANEEASVIICCSRHVHNTGVTSLSFPRVAISN